MKCSVWFNYPFAKLLTMWADPAFDGARRETKGHVLVLGPLAFAVIWRKPLDAREDKPA